MCTHARKKIKMSPQAGIEPLTQHNSIFQGGYYYA